MSFQVFIMSPDAVLLIWIMVSLLWVTEATRVKITGLSKTGDNFKPHFLSASTICN